MTTWIVGAVVGVAAWVFGVRHGRRAREPDVELAYSLGVADGRRGTKTEPYCVRDARMLAEAAADEVARLNDPWLDEGG